MLVDETKDTSTMIVSVFFHIDVSSRVSFFVRFGFNQLLDALKMASITTAQT